MNYYYQVLPMGQYRPYWQEIEDLLFKRIKELNLLKDHYQVIEPSDFQKQYNGTRPAYALYFGHSSGAFECLQQIVQLQKDGKSVLPIFFDKKDFTNQVPKELRYANGLLYTPPNPDKTVNLILESFGRLRYTRKVFISYKRDESSSVAIQLYEALEKHNFDVFLDTHSIKQGEPFQDELWQRMTDCDVIVMLNTKKFMESEWCDAELAQAGASQIGVIQLVWPNHKLESTAQLSFPKHLTTEDFKNEEYKNSETAKLHKTTISEIVNMVESVRARNLAARQNGLISDFLGIASHHGVQVHLQPERYIVQKRSCDQPNRVFIPAVGVPTSLEYNSSSNLKTTLSDFKNGEIYLIYDDLRIRQKWLEHLHYLDSYLDVTTIKKQEFESWLLNN